MTMTTLISRLVREDDGQNLIEYALLAGLITLVGVTAIKSSGTTLKGVYEAIQSKLAEIPNPIS
jgi:Flp pilus assembly pilin Flp